jgi:hypothetical protein
MEHIAAESPKPLTIEEKKKLLWSKKNTATKSALLNTIAFQDQSRSDKFLRLMGAKNIELPKEADPEAKQRLEKVWNDLEKHYHQGLKFNLEKKGLS